MQMQKYETDVLVVGGGLAGIVTSIELLNANKKVLILDRDTEANFGGLAKWSFGGMFFVNSKVQKRQGIKDSIDLAIDDWFSYAEYEKDEYWGKKWAEQYIHLSTPHGHDWLKKNDKLGGQHKIPRLSNSRKYMDELLVLNKINSFTL